MNCFASECFYFLLDGLNVYPAIMRIIVRYFRSVHFELLRANHIRTSDAVFQSMHRDAWTQTLSADGTLLRAPGCCPVSNSLFVCSLSLSSLCRSLSLSLLLLSWSHSFLLTFMRVCFVFRYFSLLRYPRYARLFRSVRFNCFYTRWW